MVEEYRKIEDYQRYSVSRLGRVRNDVTGRILKAGINTSGYQHVRLSKEGKPKTCTIHRLVCEAFHENPNDYKCVDHIDRNKQNNHVNNLRWASYQMNNRNTTSYGNVDGVGISYNKANDCYIASLTDNNGKRHKKSFSCNKYGKVRALLLAKVARSNMEYEYWDEED
jgi:hypothetical protein